MDVMKCVCSKCGYEWDCRKDVPKQCPRCKRYDWSGVSLVFRYEATDTYAGVVVERLRRRDEEAKG